MMTAKQINYLKYQLIIFIVGSIISILSSFSILSWGVEFSGSSLWYVLGPIIIIQFLILLFGWDGKFLRPGLIISGILFSIILFIGFISLKFQLGI